MKFLSKNYKKNQIRLKVENLDDLWSLSYVIEAGDKIRARTFRKIKIGDDSDRAKKIVKKPILIVLNVEKIEFSKYSNILRVSGTIEEGPEDIPLRSHHTINIEENSDFSLQKKEFLKYQKDKLESATKDQGQKTLICIHDREDAIFVNLKKYGYEIMTHIKGTVVKKSEPKSQGSDFYSEIASVISKYDATHKFNNIVLASPSFWKEYSFQKIDEKIKGKVVLANCSAVSKSAISEIVKRPEIEQVLKRERYAEETKLIEELLLSISNNLASYGIKEVNSALTAGAVKVMLVNDKFLMEKRQEGTAKDIEHLLKRAESMGGEVHIISSDHEGGQKLYGLGGIAAILRYQIK